MSRRAPGLSGLRDSAVSAAYSSHGTKYREDHDNRLQHQLSVFQQQLHQFSVSHGKEIQKNPTFRAEFARMCNAIGVDPLASSHRKEGSSRGSGGSMWAQMLGGSVKDFYFGLAVRVVEVCRATRAENGGMMAMEEVKSRVQKGRGQLGGEIEVSDDDIKRAVKSLEPLGSGFTIIPVGSIEMIRSVPKELNTDQTIVLEALQILGYVTISMLRDNLQWEKVRAVAALDDLIAESLIWVDNQCPESEFWTPTVIRDTPEISDSNAR